MAIKLWWKYLEDEPSDKNTVKEFLEEKGFTWKPISQPCYQKIGDEYKIIPNHQISVRSDNLYPIAVVKNRYKLLNNDECFKIAERFKEYYPQSKFISCGDIMKQTESYMSMILKTEIICNEEFGVWLTFTNGFDGRNAVNCTLTLIRKNDHSVFQISDKEHPRIWTLGRKNINSNFLRIYEDIEHYINYVKKICEKMNEKEIVLNDVVTKIFDIDWKRKKRINRNLAIIKEYTREIYLKKNGKTLYDLFFAITSYYCNGKILRINKLGDDKRFQMAMVKSFYELNDYLIKILDFLN